MDYLDRVQIARHATFASFEAWRRTANARLVLLTTAGSLDYRDFAFAPGDLLMVGRESAGAAPEVHASADARLAIPLQPGLRSLNVAVAAAMAAGEAARQLRLLARVPPRTARNN